MKSNEHSNEIAAAQYQSWPRNKRHSDHMRKRKSQNLSVALKNRNENWMADLLKTTGLKWTRQASWGFRLFDFWNAHLGIAIEVDGPEHDAKSDFDQARDAYNYRRSAILVLRVRNRNEADATAALARIAAAEPWTERRRKLNVRTQKEERQAARIAAQPSLL